jgi:hypothetical protein
MASPSFEERFGLAPAKYQLCKSNAVRTMFASRENPIRVLEATPENWLNADDPKQGTCQAAGDAHD